MPTSPSSSVQAARSALATRLREIRLDAGLTGRELALRTGFLPSKVSRLENGKTPPSDADIREWCAACGANDHAADLIAASRNADSMYVEWRRVQRTGLRQLQESYVPLFERTRTFRIYSSNVVPGLLQTPEYATALLSDITDFRGLANDVEAAVRARTARSRVLREGNHRFAVVVEEAVLRHRVGDAATMAGQLGHLRTVMSLPSVSLGVIPFSVPRRMWVTETFSAYDEAHVQCELLTAAVNVTSPGEVAQYLKAFGQMAALAVHGSAARACITDAIASLE